MKSLPQIRGREVGFSGGAPPRTGRKTRLPCLAAAVVIIWTLPCIGQPVDLRYVLFLNSFHQGHPWSDKVLEGIESQLGNVAPRIELHIEHMDAKRAWERRHFKRLFDLYQYKFSEKSFEVIICADDTAFQFLLQYHGRLFPGTPVVFCGVTEFNDGMLAGHKDFTGVLLDFDVRKTVEAALKLQPGTRNVIVVTDGTIPGIAAERALMRVIGEFPESIEFNFIERWNLEGLARRTQRLSSDSIILLLSLSRDESGTYVPMTDGVEFLSGKSPVAMYGCWDFLTGHGIVGGMLTSGFLQGKTAAKLALRILRGGKPAEIAIVRQSPNRFMFDYDQLKRFGIAVSSVPEGSLIINEPSTFYSVNKKLIWSSIALFGGLTALVALLSFNIVRRKRAEQELRSARDELEARVLERTTELRELNEKLRVEIAERKKAEAKYRSIFENAVEGIYQTSPDGYFISANPALAKILAYDSVEDLMESVTDIGRQLYPDSGLRRQLLERVQADKEFHGFEIEMSRKDGTTVRVSIHGRGIFDERGQLMLIEGILEDVSERKRLEEELRQAQKMEAIGTLAGGIAHDFNNILTIISGYGEILLRSLPDDSKEHSDVERTLQAARRAADLVGQILTFSRRTEEKRGLIDITPIVKETGKFLRASLPTTIEIVQNIKSGLGMIIADPTQIHQVLMNLCTNARHAMREKGGTLTMELDTAELDAHFVAGHPGMSAGSYLRLSVTDTGCGMSPELLDRIFEPYFTTKQQDEGTGLGLAVVHGIVKGCGGAVTVQSEPGKGSTFHIYWPVAQERPHAQASTEEILPRGNETILYVDDEEGITDVAKRLLEPLGYSIATARDGFKALELFRDNPDRFDLVITDMTMPKMTGVELARELWQIRRTLPVILCTGFSEGMTEEKAKAVGMSAFVMKPIQLGIISQAIREALDR